uniref:Uncharacterized protein n=1 Tax=Schizaphis graminum TaxID=13262 RepID=A0A2S2PTM3_SCHGA
MRRVQRLNRLNGRRAAERADLIGRPGTGGRPQPSPPPNAAGTKKITIIKRRPARPTNERVAPPANSTWLQEPDRCWAAAAAAERHHLRDLPAARRVHNIIMILLL